MVDLQVCPYCQGHGNEPDMMRTEITLDSKGLKVLPPTPVRCFACKGVGVMTRIRLKNSFINIGGFPLAQHIACHSTPSRN